jgi:acyl-CoA hydrolase
MKDYYVSRLVKLQDLNHHSTLFAGRTAEWFVEATFIAAATTMGDPDNIVFLSINGLKFKNPVHKGDMVKFTSKVVYAGKTSFIVYSKMESEMTNTTPVEGFVTYISVDLEGNKINHGIVLDDTDDEEELELRKRALELRR